MPTATSEKVALKKLGKKLKQMSITIAAQMHVTDFCHGNKEQLDCLARLDIHTMEDMWLYIAVMTPLVEDANEPLVIHKRHVIGLCTHRCNKLCFDFDKLYQERGVVVGGEWPNQWIALRIPTSTRKQRVVELPPERTAPTPNDWVDDEAAIAEAIRQSLAIMPPSPQLKSTSGVREVPKLKDITASMDGPLELCCPITLLLFQDPVKTLHGQTYERAAIEDWLESKSTDPMTGDILKIKV